MTNFTFVQESGLDSATPALRAFAENRERIANVLGHGIGTRNFHGERVRLRGEELRIERALAAARAGTEEDDVSQGELERAAAAIQETRAKLTREENKHGETLLWLNLWMGVMTVTITETYLHDVLVFCASLDQALMGRSDQSATYDEVVAAGSLQALADELRSRWARNFIDRTGPRGWIERLTKMGSRGYPEGLGDWMEELWGIRHIVVHRAGKVTPDFLRRHPHVHVSSDEKVGVDLISTVEYLKNAETFVRVTDAFFSRRYLSTSR